MYSLHVTGPDFLRWKQVGTHHHEKPPGARRLTRQQLEAVDSQVIRRPTASAHQLRQGDGLPGSQPLGDISPTLANPDKARYERIQN